MTSTRRSRLCARINALSLYFLRSRSLLHFIMFFFLVFWFLRSRVFHLPTFYFWNSVTCVLQCVRDLNESCVIFASGELKLQVMIVISFLAIIRFFSGWLKKSDQRNRHFSQFICANDFKVSHQSRQFVWVSSCREFLFSTRLTISLCMSLVFIHSFPIYENRTQSRV